MNSNRTLLDKYAQYNPSDVNLSIIAAKSLLLGGITSINATLILLSLANLYTFPSTILTINGYIIFICIFHLLEFFCTSLFNNSQVDDDSFILNDWDLHIVNLVAIIEFIIKSRFFDFSFRTTGFLILLMGQTCRSLAMYTANESFNHYVQREHHKTHTLVTHGIYSIIRHPSYFGFFWWFVGLQVYFGNPITLAVGIFKLWKFFNGRIEFEEQFLVNFFGNDYINYKRKTRTGIPFIQ